MNDFTFEQTKALAIQTIITSMNTKHLATQTAAKPSFNSTHQQITQVAENYFHGMANGDLKLLREAFDTEYGDVKIMDTDPETQQNTIRTIPFAKFVKAFEGNNNKPWSLNILSLDVVDDKMALVKLSLTTEKSHYIDYLTMYKRNNQWRIVNKTFVNIKK